MSVTVPRLIETKVIVLVAEWSQESILAPDFKIQEYSQVDAEITVEPAAVVVNCARIMAEGVKY